MFERALRETKRSLGPEHPSTLDIISNLSTLRNDQGRIEEARSMMRQVLEKRRRILGDEHPDTVLAKNNLASILGDQGKLDDEASLPSLEKNERDLGEQLAGDVSAASDNTNIQDNGFSVTVRNQVNETLQRFSHCSVDVVEFDIDWDLPNFRAQECSDNEPIGSVVVLVGAAANAQGTRCAEYVQNTWPRIGTDLVGLIDGLTDNSAIVSRK